MRTTLPIVARAAGWISAASLLAGMCVGTAQADDLYNTLYITDQRLYNRSFGDCIGVPPGGAASDLQLADDFAVTSTQAVTAATADYIIESSEINLNGVWVQFFADSDGLPSNDMYADYIATGSEVTVTDLGTLPNTPAPYTSGARIRADVSAAGIQLPAGTWWVSIQPIDVHDDGLGNWYWILRQLALLGAVDAGRSGGTHHTGTFGGYPGPLPYNDWRALDTIGFRAGVSPMRIEGHGNCPADFNQDGGVDGADVEEFFTAWEAGSASADVNMDGGVDGGDVATFFTAWEAGGC